MAKKSKSKYIQIAKHPFGGLINQGVTGISKALGADDKTANLIGSGVATASGFIPGFSDNLMQGADLVGDIGAATNDKNLQTAGQIAKPIAGLASNFMPNGGTILPYNNVNSSTQLSSPQMKKPMDMVYASPQGQYYKMGTNNKFGQIDANIYNSYPKVQQGDYNQMATPNIGFDTLNATPQMANTQQPLIKAKGGMIYPNGGKIDRNLVNQSGIERPNDFSNQPNNPVYNNSVNQSNMRDITKDDANPNAQLEKNEIFESPDGSVEQVNAPSHANGGINLNLEQGTRVYSDRLKSSRGKTFAKEAEAFKTDKFEKTLKDKNADELKRKTAELMLSKNKRNLDKIFEEQESQKDDNFASDVFAFGGTMMYKDGGIHIKAENRGKFTSAAKRAGKSVQEYASQILSHKENYSSTLVKRANFARNASKWKHAEGGTIDANRIPEYFPNGGTKQAFLDRAMDAQIKVGYFAKGGTAENDMNNYYNQIGNTPNQETNYTPAITTPVPDFSNSKDPYYPQTQTLQGKMDSSDVGTNPNATQTPGFNWGKLGTEAAIGTLGNLGPAAYLAQQGKRYDKQNMYNYTPEALDPTIAMRDVDQSTSANRRAIPGMTGGSGSLAINALLANKLQGDTTKSDLRQKYDEYNTGSRNRAQEMNIGNRYRTDDLNQANKDTAKSAYYQALGMVGRNIGQQGRDIQTYNSQENVDKMRMKTLDDLYSNYSFDQKSGHWIPRSK